MAKLERIELGVAEISVSGLSQGWHRMRIDDGPVQQSKFATPSMLPGEHRIEVQSFDAELGPLGTASSLTVKIKSADESVIAARIKELLSSDLNIRESAARTLRSQGKSALPALERSLRSTTDETQLWWLRAVMQAIQDAQQ